VWRTTGNPGEKQAGRTDLSVRQPQFEKAIVRFRRIRKFGGRGRRMHGWKLRAAASLLRFGHVRIELIQVDKMTQFQSTVHHEEVQNVA
jgi:hypothetical protein